MLERKIGVWIAWILPLSMAGAAWSAPRTRDSNVPISEIELLDIGIQVLDPGGPKKSRFLAGYQPINPEVRRSEATFIAVHLMRTLQETGRFGLVRVVPRNSRTMDLMVSGRIRKSSGRRLDLEIEVTDATGRHWFKRRYKQKVDPLLYIPGRGLQQEPYQELYDRIAKDLSKVQRRLGVKRLEDLRRVAELRYAAQLAPGVFGGYLAPDGKGGIDLGRLPSRDDPMMARVRRIQQRDEFFLDLLTERYQSFYTAMDESYDDYRATRFEVEIALLDAQAQANLANARSLFAPPDESPFENRRAREREDFFRHQAAKQARYIDDISRAFAMEVEPMYVELDGEVLRFEGTLEDQYAQWRKLLAQIFETETGL